MDFIFLKVSNKPLHNNYSLLQIASLISEKCMQDNIKKLNELKKKERQEKKVN